MNNIGKFLVLGLLLSLSCNESAKDTIDFRESILLEGNPINEIEVFSSGNVNMVVIDTFLVIQKAQEKFISIYNTNSYEKLVEFGLNGKGPNEFDHPELLKQTDYDIDNDSPVVYIYDLNRRRTSSVNIFNAIDINKKESAIDELEMPNIKEFLTYFYFQDDSFLLATPENGYRFLKFDFLTGERINIPFIPRKEYEFNNEISPILYRSTVVINKEQNLFATAPIGFGQLDFFDLDGNYMRSTVFDLDNDLKLKENMTNEDITELKYNIVHLQKNDKYIYALNYNNMPEAIYSGNITNNMEIQVYDWSGNAIKKYEFADERIIESFAVDKIHNRIYGYTKYEEDYNIIVYDLE